MYEQSRISVLAAVASPITAVAFGLIAWRWPHLPDLLLLSIFASTAVQLIEMDFVERRLARVLIWPTATAILGVLFMSVTVHATEVSSLIQAIAGGALLSGAYLVAALVTSGGVGAGDVRLAAPVGLILGWHGWTMLITGTVLGLVGTCVVAGVARRATRVNFRGAIPHGPGMLAGAFAAISI